MAVSRLLGPLRYLVADAIACVWYVTQPATARRAARNHGRAAGGLPAKEARRRARQSFRGYVRMLVDGVWLYRMPPNQILALCEVHGRARLEAAQRGGRGGVIAMCHFGNWDLAASAGMALGLSFTTVMAPVGPPAISNLIAWERSAHKHLELFAPDRAARGLVRALERGRFVGLLPDIPEGGPTVEVWFCNGPVRFSTVPAWLARLTGSPLLPVTCWRTGYASFRLQVHEPVPVTAGEDLHA
ncbi:MAG TPA: lysophospholipid acyltransferase family protein, partial [Candidatus Sulfotelmatobacter sp.]|nr:lysophospholipid acyltransferase family protein [Candidatus Sulfotelmatobacter sp.]